MVNTHPCNLGSGRTFGAATDPRPLPNAPTHLTPLPAGAYALSGLSAVIMTAFTP